ncbi:MAG: GerMN domain-containing protein [Desulfobulbaceae bacterium]
MNLNRWFGQALICLAVLLATAGCKEPGEKAVPAGSAKANSAYLEHFGEPPTPAQGTCFARVAYFPLAGEPGRLRAVPLFIFREEGQLAHLLAAFAGGGWEFPPHSPLRNPFPPGSTIKVTSQEGDSITIDLAAPGADQGSPDFQGMIAAVVETVLQFEKIHRVFITVAGTPAASMPATGFLHDPGRIAPAGSPLPLMVGGNWEPGQDDPEDLFINFDRPVVIQEIRLLDADGQEIRGEYFRTGFDMTVVFKPAAAHTFREGITVRVAWQVSDRRGRTGSGAQDFILKRFDHEEAQSLPTP